MSVVDGIIEHVFETIATAPLPGCVPPGEVEATAPGPALALVLAGLDLEALDEAALVEVVAAWQRQAAWAELGAALAAAELARRPAMNPEWRGGAPLDRCVASDELAMRLGWSRRAAQRLVRDGRALDGELSDVADAVAAGMVDGPRMRVLLEALRDEPYQLAWPVLADVLPRVQTRSVRQLRDDVERALLAVCPDETERRHEQAFARRYVDHPRRLPRGMAGIWAVLSAADAAQVDGMLEATARSARAGGDPRTLDQLRADALVAVAGGAVDVAGVGAAWTAKAPGTATGEGTAMDDDEPLAGDGGPPVGNGERVAGDGGPSVADDELGAPVAGGATTPRSAGPFDDLDRAGATGRRAGARRAPPVPRTRVPRIQINVTVALSTLLGLDEVPASLDGYGPLSAVQARALAHGGVWRRLVTDPLSGAVLDVGRRRYRPPADLAEHVRARDGRCAEPGCATPAERCDLDHTEEFFADEGEGRTAADNLGPLCHRANLLKTGGGFTLTQPEPGVFVWTTPAGLAYRVRPGADGQWNRLDRAKEAPLEQWN